MSFKEWSAAQSAPASVKPADKSKEASKANKPATQPEKTTAEVAPPSKP
jgi:hypothetical protein